MTHELPTCGTEAPFLAAESGPMHQVLGLIEEAAKSDLPVLLSGENGTEKEAVARLIHTRSARRQNPFRMIACGAFSDRALHTKLVGQSQARFPGAFPVRGGEFQLANGGTLLLEEIEAASRAVQKLVELFLTSGTFHPAGSRSSLQADVRLIATATSTPAGGLPSGHPSLTLLGSASFLQIQIPPLRERKADIRPLAIHLLDQLSEEFPRGRKRFAKETLSVLERYPWPKNLPQLQWAIRFAFNAAPTQTISPAHLPPLFGPLPQQALSAPVKPLAA